MSDYAEEPDNLETSQLDVISCGLGAAVLLAIVFSVVKDLPPIELSAPPFVKVVFAGDRPASEFDLVISAPDGQTKAVFVPDFFTPNGNAIPGSVFPITGVGTFEIRSIASLDQGIVNALTAPASGETPKAGTASPQIIYSVEIHEPASGKWSFDLLYRNQKTEKWNEHLPAGENAPTVAVSVFTETRQQKVKVEDGRKCERIGGRMSAPVVLDVE